MPEERPDADVVIYDGQCRFCRGGVEQLSRYDGRGRLAFLSLHHPAVAEKYPDLTHDQLMQEMVIVDRQGGKHAGPLALRYLSRRLPRLWLLAPLTHLTPMPLFRWAYRQFAKRRYQMWGKIDPCEEGACKLHFH